jgi:hypothetical protein
MYCFGIGRCGIGELGVVLVKGEDCLGVETVGEAGLVLSGVSSETFVLALLVVMTFCEMCTYSASSSSSPKTMSMNEFNCCSIGSLDS